MRPKDLEFGLLGERLGHSFSPAIHRQLAGYDTNWWNSHQRRWSPSSGRGVSVD